MIIIGKYSKDDSEVIAKIKFENEIVQYNNTLKPYFTDNDKTLLWDGQIFIHKNSNKKINNWTDKLYVQIKGKNVKKIPNKNVTFPIDINKLQAYQRDRFGTLLLVCMYTDDMEYQLYYRNLLPVDLESILKDIEKNQTSKSIAIYPIKQGQKNVITNICFNFIKNANKQFKAEIKNIEDIKDIKEIKTEYIGNNKDEFYENLLDNKLYTYVVDINDKIFVVPKEKDEKIFINQQVNGDISIDDKIYYKDYTVQKQKDGETIIIGNAITLDFQNKKINFNFSNNLSLEQKIEILDLFINMNRNNKITINGVTIVIPKDEKINLKNYEKELYELKSIKNMFDKFGIDFKENLDKLSIKDWNNIKALTNIFEKSKKPKKPLINQSGICKVTIGKLIILLWIDVEKNNYYNFFEDLSNIIMIARTSIGKKPTKEDSISPYLLLMDKSIVGSTINLFEYANWNSEIVKASFEKINRYKELSSDINQFILYLLLTYDKYKSKTDLLELSKFLCNKLLQEEYEDDSIKKYFKINYFQILKRQNKLENKDYDEIYKLKDENEKNDDYIFKCGISILLENKNDFKYYFSKLNKEDQNNFIKFPIYNLL